MSHNRRFIPVYEPDLSGNEKRYVNECLDTNWISSNGTFIDRFESAFRECTGAAHAICVSNGTVALHLAFHCLDIGPGDEVIVPTFTYIASVNTIAQTGATPVFVDCRESDWLIDPEEVHRKITPRTKAIVPVHLFGAVCDMDFDLRARARVSDRSCRGLRRSTQRDRARTPCRDFRRHRHFQFFRK